MCEQLTIGKYMGDAVGEYGRQLREFQVDYQNSIGIAGQEYINRIEHLRMTYWGQVQGAGSPLAGQRPPMLKGAARAAGAAGAPYYARSKGGSAWSAR